jgi:hypothetical protein
MGGNDIRDAFVPDRWGGPAVRGDPGGRHQSIEEGSTGSTARGRNFAWRAPNVGLTPAIRGLGQTRRGLAGIITVDFNGRLDGTVGNSRAARDPIRLDAHASRRTWSTRLSCWSDQRHQRVHHAERRSFTCQAADEFLYGIHPTKAVHDILAQETRRRWRARADCGRLLFPAF